MLAPITAYSKLQKGHQRCQQDDGWFPASSLPKGWMSVKRQDDCETYDYVTNEQSGYGLESCGQGPSESNSNFRVSQHPIVDGKFTSTTFCSTTVKSCSVAGGDKSLQTSTYRIEVEGSKTSFEEEVENEASQEGKHPMVGELHLELDGGSDLKYNEVATVLTKRSNYIKKQDNSLVIHPPNVVPLSDEWLAVSCWRDRSLPYCMFISMCVIYATNFFISKFTPILQVFVSNAIWVDRIASGCNT
ncbi:hypothetical protein L6452_05674 [Arctium lappa]|uniref:Uncharacterized protein n=1 Tax=Arctium lappa TaxID=4217 RepID=A0ACB9EGL3_ARCLA|nr:hypothetical protein L6452_05674 [Arctium lappa]